MADSAGSRAEEKHALRAETLARRNAQPDKDAVSRVILDRLFSLERCQSAKTVLFYVDVRSEVRARFALPDVLASGKTLVVPYCVGEHLELFRLERLEELALGRFGILEPDPNLRTLPNRAVDAKELDFLVVPGVAFDREGGRLGHGRGFYDRLLRQIRPEVPKVGLGFECQLVDQVPLEPHDVLLDAIITEKALYSCGISSR